MKLNDAIWGALLLLLSVALLVHIQSFPKIPGQQYGPASFPGVIAVGLAVCAALLIIKGLAARTHGHERAHWIAFEPWTRSHRHLLAFTVTLGVNAFYIVAVDWLGFIPTGIVYLAALFAVFGCARDGSCRLRSLLTLADPYGLLQALAGAAAVGTAAAHPVVTAHDGQDTMSEPWAQAFALVFDPYNIVVMLAASLFGLFVGAVPGLTATMATALLVPVTFFMAPIPAIAAIVTATAMAIFSGDIPGCLMRMPGTPASAAYTDEAYAMTKKGQAETALGAGLVFSAIGGLFGTAVLMLSAPTLAEFALKFSSFEYFWLVLLGLTCAVFMTSDRPLKGFVSLMLGLLVASVGLGNPAGFPRFTFGSIELLGGIGLIPMMIGMFAISEIIRFAVDIDRPADDRRQTDRQRVQGYVGGSRRSTRCRSCAAAPWARWSARCRAPAPTSRRGCPTVSARSSRRNRRNSVPAMWKASSSPAPPTTVRSPARGSRHWYSAFPAIRSRRSSSASCT